MQEPHQFISTRLKQTWLWSGLLALLLMPLLAAVPSVSATDVNPNEGEYRGIVQERPENTLVGTWLIGEVFFVANEVTIFEPGNEPGIGDCARVEYVPQVTDDTPLAVVLKKADNCESPPDDPTEGEFHGLVVERPENGRTGVWVIGEKRVEATENTIFDETVELAVGDCVRVEYRIRPNGITPLAELIKPADDCADNPEEPEYGEYHGIVRFAPQLGPFGLWGIGDKIVLVDNNTRFEDTLPPFGACVTVKYTALLERTNNEASVRALSIEASEDCEQNDDDEDNFEELSGIIESFPHNLIGTWVISGQEFVAIDMTRFEQSDGRFEVGTCVEIDYVVREGRNIASRIETEDDCDDEHEGRYEMAHGVLDNFPSSLIGEWTISEVGYQVTEETDLYNGYGNFEEGMCVMVKYITEGDVRTALRIELSRANVCDSTYSPPEGNDGLMKEHGIINERPDGSMFGEWNIGDETYRAIAGATFFDRDHGPLIRGICAEVLYYVEGDSRIALEIESEPRYRCGMPNDVNRIFGFISELPDSDSMTGTWTIGRHAFLVTDTTVLVNGPFAVGQLVQVFFSRNEDGVLIANRIIAIRLFDPDRTWGKVYGPVESLPETDDLTGAWQIAGGSYVVNDATHLVRTAGDEFEVGSCVEAYFYSDETGVFTARRIRLTGDDECSATIYGDGISRFFGFVEQVPPDGYIGTWVVNGETFEAIAASEFDDERGSFTEGSFVEVRYVIDDGVKTIRKMKAFVPPGGGDTIIRGRLKFHDRLQQTTNDQWTIVTAQGNEETITISSSTMLDDSNGAFEEGQTVEANVDQSTGDTTRVDTIGQISQVFMPLIRR
ncbi:MAG: hypothetical protein HC837_01280 [Chloroflexaceae bacterium]|nr:hypothetical protein [Chloroflexaceae bacterium]